MDIPRIAGVHGGVGTTLLAHALRGHDDGVYAAGAAVDLLVARACMYSLGCAQRALNSVPRPPVLVVVQDGPGVAVSRAAKARLRMTEPHTAAIVLVPFVGEWLERDDPHSAAAQVLVAQPLPKPLRPFTEAVTQVVEAVTPLLASRACPARPAPASGGYGAAPPPRIALPPAGAPAFTAPAFATT